MTTIGNGNLPQTQKSHLPATDESNFNPYTAYAKSVKQTAIVGHLLKFTKFGEWVAGENAVKIPLGTQMIAHMGDVMVGFQRWEDNHPTEQAMMFLRDVRKDNPLPKRGDLGFTDRSQWEVDDSGKERDPWQETAMMILKGVEDDEIYTFSTASKGGRQAVGDLCDNYGAQMRMRPDQFPVVKLLMRAYDHPNKQYGEIRAPVFEIVDWAPRDEIDSALASLSGIAKAETPQPVKQQSAQRGPGNTTQPQRGPGSTNPRTRF
jgi:hypothetical protein